MILIANDVGSKELLPELSKYVECELFNLEFGDFVFNGIGPGGAPYSIAVERKTWGDLIQSFEKGRLQTHQIPGLQKFDRRYLLIEGIIRPGPGMIIERFIGGGGWRAINPNGRAWTLPQMRGILLEIEELGGMRVVYTQNQTDTCRWLAECFNWWQKPYEDHSIFKRVKETIRDTNVGLSIKFERDSLLKRMIAQIAGIGWAKAGAAEKEFGTVHEMANADAKRWQKIQGIGKTIAERTVRAINERGSE